MRIVKVTQNRTNMNLFNFFTPTGQAPLNRREATPGVPATTDPNAPSNQPPKSANWEANVARPVGNKSLMVPAWYRGVSLIMQTMGQMVTQFQRINKAGGNFIEDMACLGGCINGAGCLTHGEKNKAEVDKYGREALEKTITDAISLLK